MKDDPRLNSPGETSARKLPYEGRLSYMTSLLDNVSDAVFTFDKDKVITFWNKGAEKIYGWTSEEAVGKNSLALFRSEVPEALRNELLGKADIQGDLQAEAVHYTKENKKIVVESHIIPLKNRKGEITGYSAVNREITRRKKTEEALKESEQRYKSTLDSMIEGCVIFDFNWTCTYVNEANARHAHYTKEQMIGKNFFELFPGVKNSKFHEAYNRSMHERIPQFVESSYMFPDGTRAWYEVKVQPVPEGIFVQSFDITERRLAEESLKAALHQLTFHIDNSPMAVIEFNNEFRIIQWSAKAEEIFGWRAGEVLGKRIDELKWVYEEDAERVAALSAEMLASKNTSNIHTNRNYRKDGSVITCEWYNSALVDQSGDLISVFSLALDITDRKRAEEALIESEWNFRTMANAILQLAWIARADGYIYWYNDRWYEYTGTTPEQMEGWGWQSVHDPEELPMVLENWKASISSGEPFEMVFPLRGKDGLFRSFLTRSMPLKNSRGQVTQWFGTNTDITEQKNAQEALLESRAKLLDVQALAHVGSFAYDIITGKIEWTEETFNIYEIDPLKAVPSFEVITSLFHPEDQPWIAEAIKDGMENNHLINFECRLLLPGNKVKYISYIARPVYDTTGKPIKRVGAVADITDRKLQELELRKTLEELQRSNRELEQFAYVASHDLQEPIRMVSAYTKMLEKHFQDKLDEKSSQYMYFVLDGAKRMHALIKDLLAYSRVASKKNPFAITDLSTMIDEIMRDLQLAIAEYDVKIELDKLPVIKADPVQIRQVFQNLIQNAIKFRGTHNPVIRISAQRKGGEWLFCVKDNGIGIDPEFFEKIFIIFQRLHEKEKYPGTGIGLSICKKIVEHHGGRIWVESREGEGTTFFFTLPV